MTYAPFLTPLAMMFLPLALMALLALPRRQDGKNFTQKEIEETAKRYEESNKRIAARLQQQRTAHRWNN